MSMNGFRFILKIVFILTIFENFYCNAHEVKIPFDGKSFDFNISVYQRKAFNCVPVWTIHSDPSGNRAYTYNGIAKINGITYEDPNQKAALFKKNDCHENCWEGVFGFGTKRNVISDRIKSRTKRSRSINEEKGTIYISHPVRASAKEKSNLNPSVPLARTSDLVADTFYPKLLVVVDHALYKKLGSDIEYTIKYLNIFWTAVDLQYRNVSSVDIELRITGLIIATDDKALDYVTKNSADGKSVNINKALYGSSEVISHIAKTNLTNYDAIATMIGLDGYAEYSFGDIKQRAGSSGASYNGSICMDEYNLSVFVDDGAYLGIHNAIHEVGHLLGLDHDGVRGNARRCFPKNRNSLTVMWPRFEIRNHEYWSECSLRAFDIFTDNDDESWCLKDEARFRDNQLIPTRS